MSATPRDRTIAAMDETIAHEPSDRAEAARGGPGRYVFRAGDRPLEGYTIKRAIGRGGFGEVYYAHSDAGKEVALKLIMRNLEVERRGVVQCMNLKSPHLIQIHDLKTTEAGDTFVIMEYVAGPSLASILAPHPTGLPAADVRAWLKGLVQGVAYLHDHGIVHRDLKPANLFLEEGVVKIGDYGLSKAIAHRSEPGHSESVGTCHYMAPEISTGKYHKPIDIYAIGVILYEMVTGRVPFDGETVGEVLMKHLTSRPDLSPLPEPFRGIVARALAKDPNHRPARVTDLLLPGDAPKEQAVRFIGEAKAPAADEEVLRIGAEEPVFYIGPDTRPPAPPRVKRAGFRRFLGLAPRPVPPPPPPAPPRPPVEGLRHGAIQAGRAARDAARAAQDAVRSAGRAARTAARAVRPAPPVAAARAPEPPPEPPPRPTPRARVADLATSMLLAAPLAALGSALVLPAFELFEVRMPTDPYQLAFLFGLTLLGSWGVLAAGKLVEGRPLDNVTRRLIFLAVGLLVGGAGAAMGDWTHLTQTPAWSGRPIAWGGSVREAVPAYAAFAGYFGLAFGANRYWTLASRDRKSRFRIVPIVGAGLLGGLVGLAWPAPQPWGVLVVILTAVVVQLVSPWSRQAATYARYARKAGIKAA